MTVREPEVSRSRQIDLLHNALAAWERAGIRYCILHGYDDFDDFLPSDVDCMVDSHYSLQQLISCIESEDGIRLVQHLQHESSCHYLVFHSTESGHYLKLDLSYDYRRNGRVFYSGSEFLNHRRKHRNFWIPSTQHEFGYYLIKKIAKGHLDAQHTQRLSSLYACAPPACRAQIARFWDDRDAAILEHAAKSNDWSAVRTDMARLRGSLLRLDSGQCTLIARYWSEEISRRVVRWMKPTGLHVVFLGPDGSGKSTVVNGVGNAMFWAFRAVSKHHLRPAVLQVSSSDGPVTSPHATPSRGLVPSLAKLGVWFTDYLAGYHLRIRPRLVRSTLVLFDRYYPDILVDPARYRYGGSPRLAALLWRLLPKPDIVFALDAPAEMLQARKNEVTFAEAERQRLAYRRLVASMPNGHVIDASQPSDAVIDEITAALIDHLAARTVKRLEREA